MDYRTSNKGFLDPDSESVRYLIKAYASNSIDASYTTPVSTFATLASAAPSQITAKNETKSSAFSFTLTSTKEQSVDTWRTITIDDSENGLKYRALLVNKALGTVQQRRIVEVSSNLLDWCSGRNYTTILQNDASILKVRDNTPVTPEAK